MEEQAREYRALLKRLVNLQHKLIRAFEAEVEVVSLPPDFPGELQDKLKTVIKTGLSVSQVLRAWPDDVGLVPLFVWVRPTKGVLQLEGRNWFFDIHGSAQVYFLGLPFELDTSVLNSLKAGRSDAFISSSEYGPNVEVQYLKEGRVYGVSAWSVTLFAESADSSFSDLSKSDHEVLLKQLVKEEFLRPCLHSPPGGDRFFVLTEYEVLA